MKEKVLGENKIKQVLQRLDRLTLQESQMTDIQILVAQTKNLDTVRGLVDNMRVVMEGTHLLLWLYALCSVRTVTAMS